MDFPIQAVSVHFRAKRKDAPAALLFRFLSAQKMKIRKSTSTINVFLPTTRAFVDDGTGESWR
jgi:hypothetical protein